MRSSLSDTLVEFAGLLPHELASADPDALESRLQLAMLVWNTVLLADDEERAARAAGTDPDSAFEQVIDHLVYALRVRLGAPPPDVETLVQYLVVRKLEEFPTDARAIADYHVERSGDGAVRVVARAMDSETQH